MLPIGYTEPAISGAISSAGEHCLHTAGVTGSIPVSPTTFMPLSRRMAGVRPSPAKLGPGTQTETTELAHQYLSRPVLD